MTCAWLLITAEPSGNSEFYRWRVKCSCGWWQSVPAVVTAAVVWTEHAKEAT